LRDRFGLRVRQEPVGIQSYAVVLLRDIEHLGSSPYLISSQDRCDMRRPPSEWLTRAPKGAAVGYSCGPPGFAAANRASEELEAPVLDETGVEGEWYVHFYWAPDKTRSDGRGRSTALRAWIRRCPRSRRRWSSNWG
jgi:uncharacterized protein (TIGR03435 family)